MTEQEEDLMIQKSNALAKTVCAFMEANSKPIEAFIALGMAAAYTIINLDLGEGHTTDEMADDLADQVKDYIKDMLETAKKETN